jgi:hypothetical protein
VWESADHALFTKHTSTSRSELLKKVSCANLEFFVRVRTKYRNFSRTTHSENIHQLIDQPPIPCLMAYESSDNGHKSHPTPSLMPSLASVVLEAVNFASEPNK